MEVDQSSSDLEGPRWIVALKLRPTFPDFLQWAGWEMGVNQFHRGNNSIMRDFVKGCDSKIHGE